MDRKCHSATPAFLNSPIRHKQLIRHKERNFCRMLKGNWELSNPKWVTVTRAPASDH
jgi:hypothetical protein